jgi:hypothetical protein
VIDRLQCGNEAKGLCVKRSPVLGAATGLALSSVSLVGIATIPPALSAAAPAPLASSTPSPVTTPSVSSSSDAPRTYGYAGSLPTDIARVPDRASRASRAASAARADAAAAKVAAARRKALDAQAAAQRAAAARERALANRITSGIASVPEIKQWAHRAVRDFGWSDTQWGCLDSLWTLESNWYYRETNPSSGAYGIPQSLPGDKMATVGADWRTNINTQVVWGLHYIADRYGSPCAAWAHSRANNWY